MEAMNHKRKSRAWGSGWMAVLVILAGCVGGHAYIQQSRQVTKWFEDVALPDTYRYYVSGSPYRPDAMIGVLPEFAPPAGGPWAPAPQGDQLRQTLRGMQFFDEKGLYQEVFGAELILAGGRRAGIWYSARGRGTVHLDRDGRLFVWPPKVRREMLRFPDD